MAKVAVKKLVGCSAFASFLFLEYNCFEFNPYFWGLFLGLHVAHAGLKFIILTELRIALKGLPSSWNGVGHHGLLLSILPSPAFTRTQKRMAWSSDGHTLLPRSLD